MPDLLTGLIVAGGTGGHITPGLGLARALHEKDNQGVCVEFLSIERNRSFADFKLLNFPVHFYLAPRLPRSIKEIPLFPFRMIRAFWQARRIIRYQNIDFVVGMGGYASLPALLAARLGGTRYYLCEQNAIPGRATRTFAGRAKRIFLSIPLNKESPYQLPESLLQWPGNPIRPALLDQLQKLKKKKKLLVTRSLKSGKSLRKFQILVLGGSQGALQLNRICEVLIPEIKKDYPNSRISWDLQCGAGHLTRMQAALPALDYPEVQLFGYHNHVAELYARADLLIARSGAGVICEGALFGLPMILVPYPYAQDLHQLANARYFASQGAASLIDQRDHDATQMLIHLKRLLDDASLRRNMAARSSMLAKPGAAIFIRDQILADAGLIQDVG